MNNNLKKQLSFLKSALCVQGFHLDNSEVINWIKKEIEM